MGGSLADTGDREVNFLSMGFDALGKTFSDEAAFAPRVEECTGGVLRTVVVDNVDDRCSE